LLAKDAVGVEENYPFCRPVTWDKAAIRKKISTEWQIPGKEARKVGTVALMELSQPNVPAGSKELKYRDDGKCECEAKETVVKC
jgi:hypothetical protein